MEDVLPAVLRWTVTQPAPELDVLPRQFDLRPICVRFAGRLLLSDLHGCRRRRRLWRCGRWRRKRWGWRRRRRR